MTKYFPYSFSNFCASLALVGYLILPTVSTAKDARELLVGTWDNRPLVFRDDNGKVDGLAIDILEEVAKQQNWKLTYTHGSWAEQFDALRNGKIDLLTVIAYSQKRDEFLDYPQETLINNWGVIYQNPDNHITSVEDLRGKRVALVTKVIHSKVFIELMNKFDFPFETIPADDFEGVLKLVDAGKADAGVINRVISIMRADKYNVKPTTIIFNPVQVRMAVPEGKNQDVLAAIDSFLVAAKADSGSLYYKSVNKWLKTESQKTDYSWVLPLFGAVLFIAIFASIYILLVRKEVKRRTADLSESESRFRQMAESIQSVFWIESTETGEIIYVSPAYEKIWGKSVESLYQNPRSWLDMIHPDDLELATKYLVNKSTDSPSKPISLEYRIIRPDGKERWIATHAYPVFNTNGVVYRYAGISDDVTNSKLAELALKVSKIEIEAVLNSISDVVVYGDLDRRIILTNPAMEKTFGYTNQELIGKKTSILYADVSDFENQGKRQFGIKTEIKDAIYEIAYKRKDGSKFIGETFGTKVFDAEGNTIGFMGVIRDVTSKKQVEAELLDYKDHLEDLVNERTVELSNLNKELEAFSYSVSHDLRAPLRAINGFSQILYEENAKALDDESKTYLNRIIKASVKMERLIDDLLQISRVSRVDLRKENIDLSKMAEDIMKTLQNENPERQVKCDIEPNLTAKGDKTLINVLMQNLLDNAWKYTAKKTETRIKFYRCKGNGSKATFCIEDNGTGFDIKYKDKIFQPFQRLHTDSEFVGTGIGLATVNRVVHRHGGDVWAESELEKGSRFYFNLQ